MRIAVTGGRDHRPTREELVRFYRHWSRLGGTVLLHGDARGVDRYMAQRAEGRGIPVEAFPVQRGLDGPWPGAGHRRNRRMLIAGRAEALVAFPGGRGTAHCVATARELGLPVYFVSN